MEFELFLIDYKIFLTFYWTESTVWDRAFGGHPGPTMDGPRLCKSLKADFVIRGGKIAWVSLGVCFFALD